jgi:hypothetical protein
VVVVVVVVVAGEVVVPLLVCKVWLEIVLIASKGPEEELTLLP